MTVVGYEKKHSILIPKGQEPLDLWCNDDLRINAWRDHKPDTGRLPSLRELATHLIHNRIHVVAGPVLSGAILAQMISEVSRSSIYAYFLGKPGYKVRKHGIHTIPSNHAWIFVDDVVQDGESMYNAVFETETIPQAVVAFFIGEGYKKPTRWGDVPMFILYKRKQ